MKCIPLGLALLLCVTASARLGAQPEPSECLAEARARARAAFEDGAAREAARRELEIDAASCLDPSLTPDAAHLVGTVSADRARFARDLFDGKLTLAAYRAALEDRQRKLVRLLRKPGRLRELVEGDADGDLVPDRRDRCRNTADAAPTTKRGCPVRPRQEDPHAEDALRSTLAGARILYNRSCEGAPAPRISAPLEWGRGPQTRFSTWGFNLAVAKVTGSPAGCEIFYELQLRFSGLVAISPPLPPSKILTLVYSESEDLLSEPSRAVFPLPLGPPLSSARAAALEAMLRQYTVITWRVRTVNGSNTTSEWSPFITQRTASSGVNG